MLFIYFSLLDKENLMVNESLTVDLHEHKAYFKQILIKVDEYDFDAAMALVKEFMLQHSLEVE